MKIRRFEWDNRNVAHIDRHDVTPEEAEGVFDHDPVFRKGRSEFHTVYGRTDAGRYLFMVYVRNPGGAVRIITARDMTPTERRYYRHQRGE